MILQTMLIINVQNGIQGIPKRKNFPAWEDNKDKNNFYIKALWFYPLKISYGKQGWLEEISEKYLIKDNNKGQDRRLNSEKEK